MVKANNRLRAVVLALGYAFLYIPILVLMVLSFNDSAMMTTWTGFSLRWYHDLFSDRALLEAARLSVIIAACTATAAVVVGTWVGYVLARMGRFRGFALFVGLASAPLVIPEVVLGISLLLMFVEVSDILGLESSNGAFTIWVGHVILTMAYVSVIIQSRVLDLDRSLEEAALDLGAPPVKVFFQIVLPLIAPALLSAWLLAFTLSLDDVVIASFLTGPGYTTLPLEVFSRVRLGLKPEINALATLFMLLVAIFVVTAHYVQNRKGPSS
jgi:putrescine transport system permease protein